MNEFAVNVILTCFGCNELEKDVLDCCLPVSRCTHTCQMRTETVSVSLLLPRNSSTIIVNSADKTRHVWCHQSVRFMQSRIFHRFRLKEKLLFWQKKNYKIEFSAFFYYKNMLWSKIDFFMFWRWAERCVLCNWYIFSSLIRTHFKLLMRQMEWVEAEGVDDNCIEIDLIIGKCKRSTIQDEAHHISARIISLNIADVQEVNRKKSSQMWARTYAFLTLSNATRTVG